MSFTLYEWKKVKSQKMLWGILLSLLLLNAVIAYIYAPSEEENTYLNRILDDYMQSPTEVDQYYAELQNIQSREQSMAQEAASIGLSYEPIYPCTYSGKMEFNDVLLFNHFYHNILKLNTDYQRSISTIITNLDIQEKEILSLYGMGESSFSYRKLQAAKSHYTNMLSQVDIKPEIACGWDIFFQYETHNFLALCMILLVSSSLFTVEQNGSTFLLHSTKRGRTSPARAKVITASILSVVVVLLFELSTFASIAAKTGFSSPYQYAVIFADFKYMPYPMRLYEVLLLTLASKAIVALLLTAVVGTFAKLVKRLPGVFVLSLISIIFCYIIYANADENFAKFFNIYGFYYFIPVLLRYHCINMFDIPVNNIYFCFVAFTLIAILLFLFLMLTADLHLSYQNQRLTNRKSKIKILIFKANKNKFRRKSTHLLHYELKKYIFRPVFIMTLCLMCLLKAGLTIQAMSRNTKLDNLLYEDYIHVLQEMNYDEREKFLTKERERIDFAITNEGYYREQYLNHEIDPNEYQQYLSELIYAKSHLSIFEKVDSYAQYINQMNAQKGLNAELLYDIDWTQYFSSGCDYAFILLLIFLLSGVFSDEYLHQNGSDSIGNLMKSTKRGRLPLFRSKVFFAYGLMSCFFLISIFTDIFYGIHELQLTDFSAPLLSIQLFSQTDTDITITQFYAFRFLIRFVGTLFISAVVLFFSEWLRKKVFSICLTMLAIVVPYFCTNWGMTFMRYIDVSMLLDGTRLYLWSTSQGRHDFFTLAIQITIALVLTCVLLMFTGLHFCRARKGGKV